MSTRPRGREFGRTVFGMIGVQGLEGRECAWRSTGFLYSNKEAALRLQESAFQQCRCCPLEIETCRSFATHLRSKRTKNLNTCQLIARQ